MVVVTDLSLRTLLTSGALIAQTWPSAHEDVLVLVQILKVTFPTLAEVLATGLVVLIAGGSRAGEIGLASGRASLRARALSDDGRTIADPTRNAHHVTQVDIVDVVADGRSALRVHQ